LAERLVLQAAREVLPIGALTPVNARRERERLIMDLRAGRRAIPDWTYARGDHRDLRRALDAVERDLARRAQNPVESLFLARIRELSLEAALCAAAGTHDVARLANERFMPASESEARSASALAGAWLLAPEPPPRIASAPIASDGSDPRSLLSLMRAAVRRLGLPFAVIAMPALAPLAATGERTILVATDRMLSEEDAIRTVLHEVEGHARPRARAGRAACALFQAGTARGADDQEGRAILLEERAGLLGSRRRRQLAARHHAVEAMLDGACFADVALRLVDAYRLDEAEAVIVAERAFRGGNGNHPGLGRERVYLRSLVRVRARLDEGPGDDQVMACGQVSVDAVDALRPFAPLEEV